MATLKDIAAFKTEIESLPVGQRAIKRDMLLDMLESLSDVQGLLNINNAPRDPADAAAVNVTCTGAWETFAVWGRSVDTKGLQEQPTPGTAPFNGFMLKAGGAGNWKTHCYLKGQCDTDGLIRIRFARVLTDDTVDPDAMFSDREDVLTGKEFKLNFTALKKNMVAGEIMLMQIRGPNGAVVTVHEAEFESQRG